MKKKLKYFVVFISAFMCSISGLNAQITFHESHIEHRKSAPYSDVVQVGDLFFLTGQVGFNNDSKTLASGGVKAETKQAILNIKSVLEQHNLTLNDVVKCTVILSDINDFSTFNEIYKQYFPNKPARTTFAASGLAIGAKIEIDVIAAKSK